ncbi:MAG: SpoIID/LytB domain-containing protein [Firmicutes bacterium]|nr:SpoIID/LytB domain-containing protein [Bacillota bacterium]
MGKRTIGVLVTILILSMVVSIGCPGRVRKPAPAPGPAANVPAIPDVINKGAGVEPELLVYDADKKKVVSMKMEDYIQGVVAAEMEPDWEVEALAAQAILARTFTLAKIADKGVLPNRQAHASTNEEEFQAYDARKINNNVREAVKKTRGKVLVSNGQFINAWFHAYSGGKTATAEEGLGYKEKPTPYIAVIDDTSLEKGVPPEERAWSATVSMDEIRAAVKKATGKDPGKVDRIEITEKGPSGRATKLKIGDVEVSGPAFRLAIGSKDVKSMLIDEIKVAADKATFRGRGFGHGVGMSQWGARVLAKQGKPADEIVSRYFKNVQLVTMWQ